MMNLQDHKWEDLRLVLAITQGRGLSGASRILAIHHATILRRLNSFEARMGVVLFERSARGYTPTEVGEELASMALSIEKGVEDAYRKLESHDVRVSRTIRVATSDFIAQSLLPPVLKQFREEHDSIDLEILISPKVANLAQRDADVAIRAVNDVPENLVGEKIAELQYGLYAHHSLLTRSGAPPQLTQFDWVGDDHTISHVSTNRWHLSDYPQARITTRYDSLLGKMEGIRAAMGIGFLPHFLARKDKALVCLKTQPEKWSIDLWLLTHADLYNIYQIRKFMKCAEDTLSDCELSCINEASLNLES